MRHSASLGNSDDFTSLAVGTELKLTSLAEHKVMHTVTRHTQTRAPARGNAVIHNKMQICHCDRWSRQAPNCLSG